MLDYEGHYGQPCDLCKEFASHMCDTRDETLFVCPTHYIRTRVEHLTSNHRELKSYTKWKKTSNKKQKVANTAPGML